MSGGPRAHATRRADKELKAMRDELRAVRFAGDFIGELGEPSTVAALFGRDPSRPVPIFNDDGSREL